MEPDSQLSEPFSCRYWQRNLDRIMEIGKETNRNPREVLRDIVDEALRTRDNPPAAPKSDEIIRKLEHLIEQNREQYEKLVEQYERLEERNATLKQGLVAQLRVFSATLGEVLAAAVGARRLSWNYLAYSVLRRSKYTEQQISEQWDAESKAWNAERDTTLRDVKRIVENKWPPPQ